MSEIAAVKKTTSAAAILPGNFIGGYCGNLTIGYHKIRGLAAPLRMMCYYKQQPFTNVGYGTDVKEKWFGEAKPPLLEQNACINLPFIVDGAKFITQSNSCLLHLGRKLQIDSESLFLENHQLLDQVM